MAVFIDASVFCAFANQNDVHHQKAVSILERLANDEQITTDYVFDELVSVIMRRAGKDKSLEFGNALLNSEVFIAKIDSSTFQNAWGFFKDTEKFSFTDCTILAFMKSLKIKKLATFDKEFKNVKWIDVVDA